MTSVPVIPVIRLDRSKPFGECRGERQPDDPHYKVHYWQGQKVGGHNIQLPFDAQGVLVPDDGKTAPWTGLSPDNKQITYSPLYTPAMRDLVARKLKSGTAAAPAPVAGGDGEPGPNANDDDGSGGEDHDPSDDVNFVSWLRGEAVYEWTLMIKAGKKRYGRNFTSKKQMVEDLVCDERVIPEDQVCAELAKHLPPKAA